MIECGAKKPRLGGFFSPPGSDQSHGGSGHTGHALPCAALPYSPDNIASSEKTGWSTRRSERPGTMVASDAEIALIVVDFISRVIEFETLGHAAERLFSDADTKPDAVHSPATATTRNNFFMIASRNCEIGDHAQGNDVPRQPMHRG